MDFFVAFAAVCAYIVKGMCGFANTLVFSTILGFSRNNIHISPVELLVGFPSNLLIVWKERKALSAKIYLPLSLTVIAGSIPGAFFLKNADGRWTKVIFGFVVAGIGMEMLLRERQQEKKKKISVLPGTGLNPQIETMGGNGEGMPAVPGTGLNPQMESNRMDGKEKSSPILLGVIGILSGVLCGMFGIGALLAAYVSRAADNSSSFRGNLCVVFLAENTFRVFLYSSLGILNQEVWKLAWGVMPFMALGLAVGMLLAKRCGENGVKQAVMVMLVLSGVSLVAGNF